MNHPIADNYEAQTPTAELAAVRGVLIQHANGDFLVGDPNIEDLARHIVAKLDPEPDMDTVPLQALLEAVGTFLEPSQKITIEGRVGGVEEVSISDLGREFIVPTCEAGEALTNANELAKYLIED